ncbi:hypothetical protein SIID45300_00522 [Candidatus Magnetaquicoccaceae bacterium FCR-1]|uniref:DUF3106 domain-containing protein n=1 Tax=Candidatus Magnetaquiglobus chichijimensis TaxID=3141448 RepID=A0ABQ0C5R6_9PROT
MNKQLLAATLGVALLCGTVTLQAAQPQETQPFTQAELDRFVADYPGLVQWLGKQKPQFDTARTPWLVASMRGDPNFNAQLKEKNWDPDRFHYLLNHINTGLALVESEKGQAETQARIAKERQENEARIAKERQENEARIAKERQENEARIAKERQENDARQAEGRQRMEKEMAAANKRMRDQLEAQKEQIRANPYIPPYEKQRILAQMARDVQSNAAPANAPATAQVDAVEAARQRQAAWIDAQERQIRANPFMHPMQRQQSLEQLEQAKKSLKPVASPANAAPAAAHPSDPAALRADMEKMHKQWFANQKQVINNAPTMPPAQKKIALDQLKSSEKQFTETLARQADIPAILPKEEKALIESRQSKLTELFAVK